MPASLVEASEFWERMAELVAEFDKLPRPGETTCGTASRNLPETLHSSADASQRRTPAGIEPLPLRFSGVSARSKAPGSRSLGRPSAQRRCWGAPSLSSRWRTSSGQGKGVGLEPDQRPRASRRRRRWARRGRRPIASRRRASEGDAPRGGSGDVRRASRAQMRVSLPRAWGPTTASRARQAPERRPGRRYRTGLPIDASLDFAIIPRFSRSHFTAWHPLLKIDPSSAYCVLVRPSPRLCGRSRPGPAPGVAAGVGEEERARAVRRLRLPGPRGSPGRRATPAGRPRARPSAAVGRGIALAADLRRSAGLRATTRAGRRRGRAGRRPSGASGGPTAASARRWSTSVTWTLPPVRFQRSQVSTVPDGELARAAPGLSSSQASLVAEKYGSRTSPVRSRISSAGQLARRSRPSGGPARRSPGATGGRSRAPRGPSSRAGSSSDPCQIPGLTLASRPPPPRRRRPTARFPRGRARPSRAAESAASAARSPARVRTGPGIDDEAGRPRRPWSIARITPQARQPSARPAQRTAGA